MSSVAPAVSCTVTVQPLQDGEAVVNLSIESVRKIVDRTHSNTGIELIPTSGRYLVLEDISGIDEGASVEGAIEIDGAEVNVGTALEYSEGNAVGIAVTS
mmetsp:Transcript_30053/g.41268  ORF Transcript_30053/g.41268 Transcript_30053/m.41268 type:complete len:100 (-) Transcript_30053:440-739(-)